LQSESACRYRQPAAFVGAQHSRWILQRFAALSSSAADLAREKFPVELAAGGKDEFSTLAATFNEMTRQLGLRHAVQWVLAQMDEALFNKPDIRILVRGALPCLAYDRGQGYLLGRPATADDIVRTFTQNRDFSQPQPDAPAATDWTLPPMPGGSPVTGAHSAAAAGGRAVRPVPAPADPWNDDMLEEALTVPRFLEDDYAAPGGR
jgi:HAMP domain-containing protein